MLKVRRNQGTLEMRPPFMYGDASTSFARVARKRASISPMCSGS
jgi:hypothetical protein